MAKVTGKFQITLPKALVERCGIRVGDELDLRLLGRSIHIDRHGATDTPGLQRDRLGQFDRATARQQTRDRARAVARTRSRGWAREDLYVRGRAR
jgi:AbrB family looped-hinge helix DNA binding protein